jgi:hypothetical protein
MDFSSMVIRRVRPAACRILAILLLGAPVVLQGATQAIFYVAPTGNDSSNGTSPLAAFATLSKARDAVEAINSSMTGDIIVAVAKGDYPLASSLVLTEKDSGTNGFNVIYQNLGAIGSARFIGGDIVTGWTADKDGIYKANVSGPGVATLYENGIRADLARWPKRTSPFATSRAGYMVFTDTKNGGINYVDNAVEPDGEGPFSPQGKDFSHAWVYAWNGGDGHRWSSVTTAVTSAVDGFIGIKSCGLGWPPDSFFIEGSLDLLTRPGEFYYDQTGGTLYYKSRFPGPIEKQEIVAPRVVRLLDLQGSSTSSPIHNIQFSGLAFIDTDYIAQSGADDWDEKQQPSYDAAIYVKNANALTIKNCKIDDVGLTGVTMDTAKGCDITGCLIEHTGYHGVSIRSGENNVVRDCLIRNVGELKGHGCGVALGGTNTVSHLDIYDSPRAGVAARGTGDTIEYVKVRECVQDSGDQGAFYLVDPCNTATFSQCTSFRNYCDLSNMDRPPTAVYNDRDATDTTWSNIDAGDSQMYIFRHDPQQKGTLTFDNVNWLMDDFRPTSNQSTDKPNPAFDKSKMEYDKIGVTADFPREYNDLSAVPAAPLNFWTQTGSAQATLHWTEADRAASYSIRRASAPNGPFTVVGSSAVPATGWDLGTTYTDTSLTNNRTYYYIVTSVNAAGESPASLEVQVTPTAAGSLKLAGTAIGEGGDFGKALDGDLTTCFDTQNGWVGLDLGGSYVITEIRYSPLSSNTDTTAKMYGGEFQGSDSPDFSNPTTLFTTIATKAGAGTPVLIPQAIFNSTPFRYVRYIGQNGKTTICEVEFDGHPAP